MARPMNLKKTEQKTYMLYSDDIETLLNSGKAPKDVFNLGCEALKAGWSPFRENTQITNVDAKVQKLTALLQEYITKFNNLSETLEKYLKVKIREDPKDVDLLKEKLEKLLELEKTLEKKEKVAPKEKK